MVKIPSLDDLKKAGAGLVDSAKTVNIGGVVDKLKSGIDTVTTTKKEASPGGSVESGVSQQMSLLQAALTELQQVQVAQAASIKQLENQVAALMKDANK